MRCLKYGISYADDPKEYQRIQSQKRRQANPLYYLLLQAKHRSKKMGIPFDIAVEDLEIPERCPVFDIPLRYNQGKRQGDSFSLDRLDNSKGYVKGNVRVVSFKANQYKGDMTISEVERLLSYMKGEVL